MNILVIQSCDGKIYKPMLDLVEPVNRDYCTRMGYGYKRYDGIRLPTKAPHPSYAACNRIYLLQDELLYNNYDWVLWMDADALVVDPTQPVDEFLDNSRAVIACRGASNAEDNWYDLNNGVCFYNLKHPKTAELVGLWQSYAEAAVKNIEEKGLSDQVSWDIKNPVRISDQHLLHKAIRTIGDHKLCKIYVGKEYDLFNYSGRFIKQVLRCETFEARMNYIQKLVKYRKQMEKVLIIQSCDGQAYKLMLDVVEPVNRKYCEKLGYDYKRWDGLKIKARDPKPFYATTNRVYLIQEELKRGYYDWVLYIDADAVVIDRNRPLTEFLDPSRAVVACRGGSVPEYYWWDLNAGVCFFNLRHQKIKQLVNSWQEFIESNLKWIEDGKLQVDWSINAKVQLCDQDNLHRAIQKLGDTELCKIYGGEQHNVFNYDGPFIKQVLRAPSATLNDRIANIVALIRRYFPEELIG